MLLGTLEVIRIKYLKNDTTANLMIEIKYIRISLKEIKTFEQLYCHLNFHAIHINFHSISLCTLYLLT